MHMQLTEHFWLDEFVRSQTATRLGIDNTPKRRHVAALRRLCECVLEPLREKLGQPIHISSGYRCRQLNSAIHGSPHSSHMRGEAADIIVPGWQSADVAASLHDAGLPYDQLIEEFGAWVHVSHSPRMRGEYLLARRDAGHVKYEKKHIV